MVKCVNLKQKITSDGELTLIKKIKPRNLENDQSTNIFKVGIIIVSVFQRTSPLHKRK